MATRVGAVMTTDRSQMVVMSGSDASDLLRRAGAGDQAAFAAILDRVGDGILRRALAILRDEADARDATQETLLRIWRELPRLRSEDRFEAWVDRILMNVCRDRLRRGGGCRIAGSTTRVTRRRHSCWPTAWASRTSRTSWATARSR